MTEITDIVPVLVDLLKPFNSENIPLSEATDIPAELNIDSVGVLDFIMEVEDHFDVEIPMNAVASIRTVGELAAYVQTRLNKA
ncbi:acyl carrier protein [Aestuariivirga litoralis]|uniref:acyl carrier protein n=1 Tax=Aestuariivirga litoralis TaxID=2650924 RepID=UPI0018C75240|nr:acyl carrier protein [Aestuariivirga litoralis]MBG1230940.1 acyl carrier protein [Aestuariivirga litoralis]